MSFEITLTDAEAARFWNKIDVGDCWEWTAAVDDSGYGRWQRKGKTLYAHRVSYSALVGPIPDGMQLDHLCRVRHCVNPDHLEVVSPRTNTIRGTSRGALAVRRGHCHKGHAFDERNTYLHEGRRYCKACQSEGNTEYMRAYRARKKAEVAA